MTQEETFGEFVKRNREKLKMGSRELSKLIGKGTSYVSQIENGRNKNPDYRASWALLNVFNIDEDKKESTLNNFGIYEPENHQKLDEEFMMKSFKELLEELDKEKHSPSEIIFNKKIRADKREELENKINEIYKMLHTDLDFNPQVAEEIINTIHQSLLKDTNKIIVARVKELMETLDVVKSITLSTQLKDEIKRRGLTEILLPDGNSNESGD